MRKLGKVSAVKSQGQCGSCWAFAAMSVVESRLLPRREGDFSENNLKDTSGFEYGPCDGGNKDMGTAYLARWSGPVDESADPYSEQGNKRAPEFPSARARRHTQEAFFLPDRSGPKDNDLIKDALAAYGAVWTTIRWEGPSSQSSPQYNAATHAYAYYGGDGSNHGVAIVGWDDNYDRKNFSTVPPGDGAFIVKNSWGEAFGEKGYFYLSYYDSNVTENVVYPDIGDMQEYTGIYQYDPLGNTQSIGYQSDTGFFSNRFTAASDNEKVKAVGFYTTAMNSGYSIAVSVEAGAASAPGVTTVSKKTGVMPYAGYHTVVLDDEVSLSKGQAFFVGVGVTTPGYNFPIPLESAVNGYSAPISEAGQSFISPDGQHWTDVTVDYPNANVCVKAFTVDGGHGPDSR